MSFSFPQNPTLNQTYTRNSITWAYNGKGWTKSTTGGASVTSSATAPASPTDGSMWLDSESGDLYVYGGGNWILTGVNPGPSFSGSYNDLTDKPAASTISALAVSNQQNTSTGYFSLPSGTTAQRPATAYTGATRLNTTTNYLEIYTNNTWMNLIYVGVITATYAGTPTIISTGGYTTLTFTSSGSFTVTDAPSNGALEVLVVAGGGGGGNTMGGGGGGGGLIYSAAFTPTLNSTYSIVIGGGGTGAPNRNVSGTSGSNTTAFGYTAIGGGGGGSWEAAGLVGGSGGGAPNAKGGGAGTAGQGYAGGSSATAGSGGGGASAAATSTATGPGGAGLTIPSFNNTYAGGGGGGAGGSSYGSFTTGLGGAGGGGRGGLVSSPGTAGTVNTGGGGGGGSWDGGDYIGGTGGSGVVVVRYRSS